MSYLPTCVTLPVSVLAGISVLAMQHWRRFGSVRAGRPAAFDILNETTPQPASRTLRRSLLWSSGRTFLVFFLYAYFGCSNWDDVPTWPKQYDMPLGAPLGHAALGGDGTWRRRRFRTGTTASINYHAGVASIDWGTAATPTTGEND